MGMKLSNHAQEKWNTRFYDYNLLDEWSRSKVVAGRNRKRIDKLCPAHIGLDREYRVTDNGIVFVVGDNNCIITVFGIKLKDLFRKGKRTRIKEKSDLKARFSKK